MNTTRAFKEKDIEDIARLNLAVQAIHSTHYPDIFKTEVDVNELIAFYLRLVDDDKHHIYICESGSKIVGYCWAELIHKKETPISNSISTLYIHQICVDEQYRDKGLGKALISEVKNLASILNVNHLEVDSWSFNAPAVEFFRLQGFNLYNERMWLK